MGEVVQSENYRVQHSNEEYNTFSAIKLRLDVQEELERFRASISGETITYVIAENGEIKKVVEQKQHFEQLMNKVGIDAIMAFMEGMISPHNAMGNVNRDDYGIRLCNISKSVARMLHINKKNWEMTTKTIAYLFPLIVHKIGFFLTRAIDDGERKSMTVNIGHSEGSRQSVQEQKKGFLR